VAAVVKDDRLWRIAESVRSVPDSSASMLSQSGSKFGNISSASASVLNGTQSQIAKNFSHIASTFEFLCAASIASCDFHSETSTTVPSRARVMLENHFCL
jgi:hypothetical protein